MKILSILRLSFHSLWQSKTRSLLAIVVLAVVSFVVVLLAGAGYSFYISVDQNIDCMFRTVPTVIDVRSVITYRDRNLDRTALGKFTVNQADAVLDVLDNDDGYFTSVSFFDASSSWISTGVNLRTMSKEDPDNYYKNSEQFTGLPYYAVSNPFAGLKNDGSTFVTRNADSYLKTGRMWNKETDSNSNNIWLSSNAADKYNLGDTITLESYYYNWNNSSGNQIVCGKKQVAGTVQGFLNVGSSNSMYVFIEYRHFNETRVAQTNEIWYNGPLGGSSVSMTLDHVYATMVTQPEFTYGINAQNYMRDILKKVDAAVTPTNSIFGSTAEMASVCNTLEKLKTAMNLTVVVVCVALFISLVIILLSVGCVANTIKISAEKSRKFFGVMKAVGMKNKSLHQILTWQIVIMMILGVAIASLGAFLIIGAVEPILGMLLGNLFGFMEEVAVICAISPVIPFAVAAALTGIVLLFTRSNMRAISKMDVITVINEVN